MKNNLNIFCLSFFTLCSIAAYSQTCDSLVPSFTVDLSSKSDSTWTSSTISRNGYCCSAVAPDKCLEFKVTISSSAIGVIVHIYTMQFGSNWINNNCSSQTSVEDTIFFVGQGPHSLTHCKPGNTSYIYAIESVPGITNQVSDISSTNQSIIYPNPATDFISIDTKSFDQQTYDLKDVNGRIIQRNIISGKQEISLSDFLPGFYVIELRSGNHAKKYKIIKL